MHDVTSAFISTLSGKAPPIIRAFTFGSSDYSAYVIKWPKVQRKWNEIKPQQITINLANQEQLFNFLEGSPAQLNTTCNLDFGVRYAVGSEETINLFSGKPSRISFNHANLSLTLVDKFKTFTEVVLGTSDVPLEYTGSDYLPSDIAWWLMTSYGGLSTITSTSNPDINYASFQQWAEVFSSDNIFINAYFDGKKLNQGIRKIGTMTRSTIIVENDKINFARYDTSSSNPVDVGSGSVFKFSLTINERDIVNRQVVHADYSVTSRYYQAAVFDISTPSVNSFGLHEELEEDPNVWYTTSASALNLATRILFTNHLPIKKYLLQAGIGNSYLQIGDTIGVSDKFHSISADTVRIMAYSIDLEKAIMQMEADASQLISFFYLDNSSLGLLDQSYNPLA